MFRGDQPLWHYEDITAKEWSIRSGEQLDVFLQHILRVFHEFLPHALISERWAQTAIQLGLSCSSRHYAGRSLQVYRNFYLKHTNQFRTILVLAVNICTVYNTVKVKFLFISKFQKIL